MYMNPYQRAMDKELSSCTQEVANEGDSYKSAERKLKDLIEWHVSVATDPKVNGGYQLVHKDALVVTDNTEVISNLNREVESLQEQLYYTRNALMDALEQRDAARARGDYWQGVAQGDMPEDH